MRSDEFIAQILQASTKEDIQVLREKLPLGQNDGELIYAQKTTHLFTPRHTAVTGEMRTTFIKRLILTLSQLYSPEEAHFFILSTKSDYGELLSAKTIDLTLPFIRTQEDFELAVKSIKDLIANDEQGKYRRKTFIVIDGIESLTKSALLNDLENYRNLLDYLTLKQKVDVITGVDLMQSIFSGNPGVFVGFGNCLITVHSPEKADVTYVNVDFSLSTPTAFEYPSSPTFLETVASLNTAMEGIVD